MQHQPSSDAQPQPPESTAKKLSFGEKFSYGLGGGAEIMMANVILVMALPIYNVGLGVKASLIGAAIGIPKLWDALIDPLMGNLSDNVRWKWGRRRPFIFLGAVLSGLLCAALWFPPTGLGDTAVFAYFTVISVLFYTMYTVFFVPYNAIGYEMTSDYNERTHLFSYKWFIGSVVGAAVMPFAVPLCLKLGGGDEVAGARYVGAGLGVLIILFGVIPALRCKERVVSQSKVKLVDAVKFTLKNPPFLLLCGLILMTLAGVLVALPLRYYINLAYIYEMDKTKSADMVKWMEITYQVLAFASIPLITKLADKYGKKSVLVTGLCIVAAGTSLSWFYVTPDYPWLQLLMSIAVAPGMSCVWVMTSSCIADVCDIDELHTGLRREGMYGAIFTLLMKLGVALVLALGGLVIDWSGFDRELMMQSEETITRLRLTFAIAPSVLLAIAIGFAIRYPVTKAYIEDVQRQLAEAKSGEPG